MSFESNDKMVRFFVRGQPISKGSFRPGKTKDGRAYIAPADSRTKPWQSAIAETARVVCAENNFFIPKPGRACVTSEFFIDKRGHDEFDYCNQKPDLDKLQRTVLDALEGVAYENDSQVVIEKGSKWFNGSQDPGVDITIEVVE